MKDSIVLDTLDFIGYYGPTLIILANLWFLQHRLFHMFLFIVYVCIAILLTKQLKQWIRDPRPESANLYNEWMALTDYTGAEQYGMPSGHSLILFFSLFYLWWMKPNVAYMIFGLFIAALTLYQRYAYKKHSALQLGVGAVLGIALSYVAYIATNTCFSKMNVSPSNKKRMYP